MTFNTPKNICHQCKNEMKHRECVMEFNGVPYNFHSPCISKFLTNRTINANDPRSIKVHQEENE